MARARKHRRIAYRVQLSRPFRHEEDGDLIDGVYKDPDGDVVGPLIVREQRHREPEAFLVVPDEAIPLIHVEAAFDNDHRITAYEQVFGLIFQADEPVDENVRTLGDPWDGGDIVVYAFETDEEALEAQE